jgi:hypothetical protein
MAPRRNVAIATTAAKVRESLRTSLPEDLSVFGRRTVMVFLQIMECIRMHRYASNIQRPGYTGNR